MLYPWTGWLLNPIFASAAMALSLGERRDQRATVARLPRGKDLNVDTAEIVVTVCGVLFIGLILWFFFGPRHPA